MNLGLFARFFGEFDRFFRFVYGVCEKRYQIGINDTKRSKAAYRSN